MWGSLPLQLKILIARIDPTTLTWYRFTGAIVCVAASRSACLSSEGCRRFGECKPSARPIRRMSAKSGVWRVRVSQTISAEPDERIWACQASSSATCRRSDSCREWGLCDLGEPWTGGGCEQYSYEGTDVCSARRDADCRRSRACVELGRCAVGDYPGAVVVSGSARAHRLGQETGQKVERSVWRSCVAKTAAHCEAPIAQQLGRRR